MAAVVPDQLCPKFNHPANYAVIEKRSLYQAMPSNTNISSHHKIHNTTKRKSAKFSLIFHDFNFSRIKVKVCDWRVWCDVSNTKHYNVSKIKSLRTHSCPFAYIHVHTYIHIYIHVYINYSNFNCPSFVIKSSVVNTMCFNLKLIYLYQHCSNSNN